MTQGISIRKIEQRHTALIEFAGEPSAKAMIPVRVDYDASYRCKTDLRPSRPSGLTIAPPQVSEGTAEPGLESSTDLAPNPCTSDVDPNFSDAFNEMIKSNFQWEASRWHDSGSYIPIKTNISRSKPKDDFGRLPIAGLKLTAIIPFETAELEFEGCSSDRVKYTAKASIYYQVLAGPSIDHQQAVQSSLETSVECFRSEWAIQTLDNLIETYDTRKTEVSAAIYDSKQVSKFNVSNMRQDGDLVILDTQVRFSEEVSGSIIDDYEERLNKFEKGLIPYIVLVFGLFGGIIGGVFNYFSCSESSRSSTHLEQVRQLNREKNYWVYPVFSAALPNALWFILACNVLIVSLARDCDVTSFVLVLGIIQLACGPITTFLACCLAITHYFDNKSGDQCPIGLFM